MVFLSGLLLVCCDGKLDEKTYRFQIVNESEDEIEINIFNTKTQSKIKTLKIARNDIISQDFMANAGDATPRVVDLLEGDSVRIIFKNYGKLIIYQCNFLVGLEDEDCGAQGNIVFGGDPKWLREQIDNLFLYTYTFTNDDFEKAASCDGNCD